MTLEDAETGWEQWRGGTQAEIEGQGPRAAIPITGGAVRVTASRSSQMSVPGH